jgi:uncharacterized protein
MVREVFFVCMLRNAGQRVFYGTRADFEVDGTVYEIGGRGKSLKQISADLDHAYLVDTAGE